MVERIALISDIHGNLDALEAVLKDLRNYGIGRYLCLGDLAFNGPYPAEAVDIIRNIPSIAIIKGNTDDALQRVPQNVDTTEGQKILWTRDALGGERLEFLNSLPFSAEVQVGGVLIRGVHASPKDIGKVLDETSPKGEFDDFLEYRAGLYCYGHIHRSLLRWIDGIPVVNPGSIGFTIGMDPMPHYAIIEADGEVVTGVDLRKAVYDVDRAIERGKRAGMPGFEMTALDWKNGRKIG